MFPEPTDRKNHSSIKVNDIDTKNKLEEVLFLFVGCVADTSWEKFGLPMAKGGRGLRSVSRTSGSAYWANWPDSF